MLLDLTMFQAEKETSCEHSGSIQGQRICRIRAPNTAGRAIALSYLTQNAHFSKLSNNAVYVLLGIDDLLLHGLN
jgi:hypothetical protein